MPAVTGRDLTSLGLSSTSDVITLDQNWHYLCSTSAGGKDLSSDAQIRVIGLKEPEICTQNVERKTQNKICRHHTWLLLLHIVKVARLDDAFLEVF